MVNFMVLRFWLLIDKVVLVVVFLSPGLDFVRPNGTVLRNAKHKYTLTACEIFPVFLAVRYYICKREKASSIYLRQFFAFFAGTKNLAGVFLADYKYLRCRFLELPQV
jgi:hypothetical protein